MRAAVFALSLIIAVVVAPARGDERIARVDAALAKAAAYLVSRQDADGAYRSGVHGSFRDGVGLTPHVASVLPFIDTGDGTARAAYRRSVDHLLSFVNDRGELEREFRHPAFPVYTLAAASWVVTLEHRAGRHGVAERAFLDALLRRQLSRDNGWSESDLDFGGWGYFFDLPTKPSDPAMRHSLLRSNLSATVYAIGAMKHAKHDLGGDAWADALRFVERCQNFEPDPARRDERFDDGGFTFGPDDAAANKPGIAGVDRHGRTRLASYGSMTADGLRALIQCGAGLDDPRVVAAIGWLGRNFDVERNPGVYAPDRVVLADATYYYWLWSLSHATRRAGVVTLETPGGRVVVAERVIEALLARQQPDGSWKSHNSEGREDDPLVATPFAAAALRVCRDVLIEQQQSGVVAPAGAK